MPKHLQGKPATCLHVVSDALGWRMDPFKVALLSFVVSGTLCYMAQISTAVINMKAPIKGRIKYRHDGEGDKRRCTAFAKCLEDAEEVEYTTPEVGKISPKNSPLWKTDPDQQLCYYAGRALCRRYFPDVLLGTYFRDEVVDNPKMIEHREYERIANPLGGNGEEMGDDEPTPEMREASSRHREIAKQQAGGHEARQKVAGGPEVGTGSNQPQDQKASPEPSNELGNGKRRQTRKKEPETAQQRAEDAVWNLAFPTPWQRQSSGSYVQYALAWVMAAPSQERARERWNTERAIRNGLANPLNPEQMAACQEALGKVGAS